MPDPQDVTLAEKGRFKRTVKKRGPLRGKKKKRHGWERGGPWRQGTGGPGWGMDGKKAAFMLTSLSRLGPL